MHNFLNTRERCCEAKMRLKMNEFDVNRFILKNESRSCKILISRMGIVRIQYSNGHPEKYGYLKSVLDKMKTINSGFHVAISFKWKIEKSQFTFHETKVNQQ